MRTVAIAAGIVVTIGLSVVGLSAPETQPADAPMQDASILYQAAADSITVEPKSPTLPDAPPYLPDSARWLSVATPEWNTGATERKLVRKARSITDTVWPDDASYQDSCRKLAENLGDAALYLDYQGRHAEGVEEVRDIFHFADLLQEKRPSNKFFLRVLFGAGVRAIAANCLEQIASAVPLTNDPGNDRDLQTKTAHELIAQMFSTRKAIDLLTDTLGGPPGSAAWMSHDNDINQKTLQAFDRIRAECIFAAMSLACHLYQFDKGHWPSDLSQLVPAYLPSIPLDPWGDGKQTFGYVVIKGSLPDGSDRPLIYCRCLSQDGLFFRTDRPAYGFYNPDNPELPVELQKHGGQFRDIVRWQPQTAITGPAIQPLP
jgi:hypothetical protein